MQRKKTATSTGRALPNNEPPKLSISHHNHHFHSSPLPPTTMSNRRQIRISAGQRIDNALAARNSRAPPPTFAQLAVEFGVPRTTIPHRARGRITRERGHQRRQKWSSEEEKVLASCIKQLQKTNCAPTPHKIGILAEEIPKTRDPCNRVSLDKHWVASFLRK